MGHYIDLIAGLGNPDPEYLMTRHNAGYWFVDAVANEHGGRFARNAKLAGALAETRIGGERIRLLKPLTYMNDSGRALAATIRYFKIPLDRVLVAYDELDLPPGRIRLKFGGGHAGHNGVRSIIEHVGPAFWRLRIGVGHPGAGARSRVIDHVLKRASASDEDLILAAIGNALGVLPQMLEQGPARAQQRLHSTKNGDDGSPEGDQGTEQ
jgi:PTH1 family peptidyl-tRNA hydrolase